MQARGASHRIGVGTNAIDAREFSAVWARKVWTPRMADNLDPRMREGCLRESTAALYGFLDGFSTARWVNPLSASNDAENKLRQLRLAHEIGLPVPRTIVTNDPDEAREFHREAAPIVAKMLTPLSTSMTGTSFFVHTSPVSEQDLEHLEGLRHSPMVFQENIAKDVELRVICVGEQHFVGAIDASQSQAGRTDWRAAKPGEVRWARASLPDDVAVPLHRLLERLDLVYGAVDLIRRPDGEHVFLEVNPGGGMGHARARPRFADIRSLGRRTRRITGENAMRALIITHTKDNECIDKVTQALAERGVRAFRLDNGLVPDRDQDLALRGQRLCAHHDLARRRRGRSR